MKPQPKRTQAQRDLNFTKQDGIDIQTEQLEGLRSIMSPSAFAALHAMVTVDNDQAYDGFDIIRGNDIDEILHNDVIPLFNK